MQNIILLGLPGSGKGTQANILAQRFGFIVISTGTLLRQEVANNTLIGKKLEGFLGEGKLVPDELLLEILFKALQANAKQNIIFDGFPRNVAQANLLDKYLTSEKKVINAIIELQVPEQILEERILQRYICAKCEASYANIELDKFICNYCNGSKFIKRRDDNSQILLKRIEVYKAEILAIKKYYEKHNILYEINGTLPIAEVTKKLNEIILSI